QPLDGGAKIGPATPIVDVEDPAGEVAVDRDLASAGPLQDQAVRNGDLVAVQLDGPLQSRLEDDGIEAGVVNEVVGFGDGTAQAAGGAVILEVGDGERGRQAAIFKGFQAWIEPAATLAKHGGIPQ